MKSVLLRLSAPLQSWGTQGRFGVRDTDREPSKSGVIGLVGAALGMARSDHSMLARLRSLSLATRVDREGTIVRDYHTIGGGRFLGAPHRIWSIEHEKAVATTAITQRYYLADASFLSALGGEDHALVDDIATALLNPVWPLFLGRRSCPPAERVFAGLVDCSPEEAVLRSPIQHDERESGPSSESLRVVLETNPRHGQPRQDEPEQFDLYARKHGLRYVRMVFIDRASLPAS